MKKDKLEMLKKFEELQRNMFVKKEYIDGNVRNFIKKLKEIDITTETNIKNRNLGNFLGREISRLQLIENVLYTKKLSDRIGDLVDLGQYLKELGEEFINFSKSNGEEIEILRDEKDSKKDKEQEAKDLFEKIIGTWLDDE